MSELPKQALGGVAGTLNEALNQSAHDLESAGTVTGHNHRMTLAIVAGSFFLLGFLWAKARAQSF
ncbi:MAG TPA: hypothetical protein VMF03_11565 [Steroidobacteraceae bacterium]|nr:hypothetical protein [Steroidobacteraceae bacterium]